MSPSAEDHVVAVSTVDNVSSPQAIDPVLTGVGTDEVATFGAVEDLRAIGTVDDRVEVSQWLRPCHLHHSKCRQSRQYRCEYHFMHQSYEPDPPSLFDPYRQ